LFLFGLIVFKGTGLILVVDVGDWIRALDSIMFSFTFKGDSSDSNFFTGLITLLFKGKVVFVFLGEF